MSSFINLTVYEPSGKDVFNTTLYRHKTYTINVDELSRIQNNKDLRITLKDLTFSNGNTMQIRFATVVILKGGTCLYVKEKRTSIVAAIKKRGVEVISPWNILHTMS